MDRLFKIRIYLILPFLAFILAYSCKKSEQEDALISRDIYNKFNFTNLRYSLSYNYISGEFFNHSNIKISKVILKFDLYRFDSECDLKKFFDEVSEIVDIGDFCDFAYKIRQRDRRVEFHRLVSEHSQIGPMSKLDNIVEDFKNVEKTLVLSRNILIIKNIDPGFSTNFDEKFTHSFTGDNYIYHLLIAEVYGEEY